MNGLLGLLGGIVLGIAAMYLAYRMLQRRWARWLLAQKPETEEQPSVLPTGTPLLAPLSIALRRHLREWRQAYVAQTQFAQDASHELQTPLAVIKGQVELLAQSPRLEAVEMEALQLILQNTNRLARLNGALILLSSIDEKRYAQRQPVILEPLLQDLLRNFQDAIRAADLDVQVEVAGAPEVLMNPTLADIMLANLLQNAIRHNLPGGWIRIELTPEHLTIHNTGPALKLAPEQLFARFVRQSEKEEGLGLGLSIIQRIGTLYGFRIRYTTTPTDAPDRSAHRVHIELKP